MSPLTIVVTTLLASAASATDLENDAFLQDCRESCLRSAGLFDCGKYKAAYLISRIASTQRSFDMGPVRVIGIQTSNRSEETILSRASTYSPQDPQFLKLFKYGVRQLGVFLQSHGFSLPLGGMEGARLVNADGSTINTLSHVRGLQTKKKLALTFPLLTLFKFGVIKAILLPILLSVLFIKKVLIIAILILPSILSTLKICKIMSPYQHSPYYQPIMGATGTGYGSDLSSYAGQNNYGSYDSYTRDWNVNQRKMQWATPQ